MFIFHNCQIFKQAEMDLSTGRRTEALAKRVVRWATVFWSRTGAGLTAMGFPAVFREAVASDGLRREVHPIASEEFSYRCNV